jgi:small subunit ribosomal protein S20
MPILPNAKKALRVSKRKTTVNSRIKSILKTMVDKVKKSPSAQNLSDAYSALDVSVKNHLMHKNKAARVKSQLSKLAKPEKKVVTDSPKKEVKKTTKKAAPKKAAAKKPAKK